jgi:Wnt-binding factor required for Wnt secretion.
MTFYIPKVVIVVGPLWFMAMLLASWQHWTQVEDPTFSYKSDTEDYHVSLLTPPFYINWIVRL